MANDWIKANLFFGQRVAGLMFGPELADRHPTAWQVLQRALVREPELAEEVLLDLIRRFRPELAGGVLIALGFDPLRLRFLCAYSHPSLPHVALGEMLPEINLFDDAAPHAVLAAKEPADGE